MAIARASALADEGEATGAPRALRPTARRFSLDLRLPAEAASLTLIRHAIGGTATALGMAPAAVADVRLALTEACSAAIRRTAEGGEGELHITAGLSEGGLRVVVGHTGSGGGAPPPGAGLPLPLVAALADAVELTRGRAGTEVAMTFSTAPAPAAGF